MTVAMAGKAAPGMIGEKPVIDAIGKVMGILVDILSIKSIITKGDANF